MKSFVSYFLLLARKWAWIVVLGVLICSSATYLVSKKMHPVYQASTTLIVSLGTSVSAYDNLNASVQAVPTYAQLVTSNQVLGPVAAQYRGVTIDQLKSVTTVKQQTNTQLIEVDVENGDPHVAMQVANQIGQSFAQFANTRLPGTVEILPAQLPTDPVRPKALLNTAIGALVGLGLALALIVAFEWIDDRIRNPEEVQTLLGGSVVAVLPWLTRTQRTQIAMQVPAFAEGCRIICARLQAAQKSRYFKLLMVTSPYGHEGKSIVASHIATQLAMTGHRVLLVDANQSLLTPKDTHAHGQRNLDTANDTPETWAKLAEQLNGRPSNVADLHTLTISTFMAQHTELLPFPWNNSFFEHFRRAEFDYIIFDTPSLLSSAASQVLASSVQSILMVVDAAQTPHKVLARVKSLLDSMSIRAPMIVINKSDWPEWRGDRRIVVDTSYPQLKEVELQSVTTSSMAAQNGKIDPDATITLRSAKHIKTQEHET